MNAPSGEVLWSFDLGNTSLKGRWSRGGRVGGSVGIGWGEPAFEPQLAGALRTWPAPSQVLVASVAPAGCAACLRRALRAQTSCEGQWLVTPRQACGIVNCYRQPARLGIDRFLAMAGARAASGGSPLVVVGCGTALTLDAVDASGRQREGLIAPSPDLMVRSLRGATAIGETNPDAFRAEIAAGADDTQQAIYAGCWRAAVALIETFYARHQSEFGSAALWLHGGGAPALEAALTAHSGVSARLLEDAIWRGLEAWAAAAPVAACP